MSPKSLVEAPRRNISRDVSASVVLIISLKNDYPWSGRIVRTQRRSLTCMLYVRAARLQSNSAPDFL